MERIRQLDAGADDDDLRGWPPLAGRVGWRGEQLVVSAALAGLLAAALGELARAAAVAARCAAASREERTFLPRFWWISRRNVARLHRLGVSLGDDEIHYLDSDTVIECEVGCLGI